MKKIHCEACRADGRKTIGNYLDHIYQADKPYAIRLCYCHSVELFKTGQTTFMMRYQSTVPVFKIINDSRKPLENYFVFNSFR